MTTQDAGAGHTPTPWQMSGIRFAGSDQILDGHTIGPDGDAVALVFYTPKYHAEQLANAAFIVRACNAHDALVAALQAMQAFVAVMAGHGPDATIPETIETPIGATVKIGDIMRATSAALALAVSP